MVNGIDVGLTAARTARKPHEDFDIDEELADISRYYAKRTLLAADNDDLATTTPAVDDSGAKSMTNDGLANDNVNFVLHTFRDIIRLR